MAVRTDHVALRDLGEKPLGSATVELADDHDLLPVHMVEVHDVVRVATLAVGAGHVLDRAEELGPTCDRLR